MITHVRIENFRSLKDTWWIQIKPVNILLGANSSGKSSFLRSFYYLFFVGGVGFYNSTNAYI